jgi:hypothetical protein
MDGFGADRTSPRALFLETGRCLIPGLGKVPGQAKGESTQCLSGKDDEEFPRLFTLAAHQIRLGVTAPKGSVGQQPTTGATTHQFYRVSGGDVSGG